MNQQQSLVIRPIEAQLTHNVELLGRMDPYIIFRLGGETVKTEICKDGGKTPKWNDSLVMPKGLDNLLTVEVFNDNLLRKDKLVGACDVNLSTSFANGRIQEWYDLYYNEKPAGKIYLSITDQSYSPSTIGKSSATTQPFITTQPFMTNQTYSTAQPYSGTNAGSVSNQLLGNMTIGTENRVMDPTFPTSNVGFDTGYRPVLQGQGQHLGHHEMPHIQQILHEPIGQGLGQGLGQGFGQGFGQGLAPSGLANINLPGVTTGFVSTGMASGTNQGLTSDLFENQGLFAGQGISNVITEGLSSAAGFGKILGQENPIIQAPGHDVTIPTQYLGGQSNINPNLNLPKNI